MHLKNVSYILQLLRTVKIIMFYVLKLYFIGKYREEREERVRVERRQQQLRYRALAAAAQYFRGVPNCYSPNPTEERPLLLDMDMTIVPVQVQTE